MIHEVKTEKQFFQEAIDGNKPFTIRKDDRTPKYQVGDTLRKIEIETAYADDGKSPFVDPFKIARKPTGRQADFVITYKLDGGQFGLASGYCVLGIKPADNAVAKLLNQLDDEIKECTEEAVGEGDEAFDLAVGARETAFRQARRLVIAAFPRHQQED